MPQLKVKHLLSYALQSCRMFVLGCPNLLISVNHKPLVSIFSDQALEKISNPRLLNFKERSLMYRFKVKHTPGKRHVGTDATSIILLRYRMPANSAQFSRSLPFSGTLQIPPMWRRPSCHPLQQAMVQTNTSEQSHGIGSWLLQHRMKNAISYVGSSAADSQQPKRSYQS